MLKKIKNGILKFAKSLFSAKNNTVKNKKIKTRQAEEKANKRQAEVIRTLKKSNVKKILKKDNMTIDELLEKENNKLNYCLDTKGRIKERKKKQKNLVFLKLKITFSNFKKFYYNFEKNFFSITRNEKSLRNFQYKIKNIKNNIEQEKKFIEKTKRDLALIKPKKLRKNITKLKKNIKIFKEYKNKINSNKNLEKYNIEEIEQLYKNNPSLQIQGAEELERINAKKFLKDIMPNCELKNYQESLLLQIKEQDNRKNKSKTKSVD